MKKSEKVKGPNGISIDSGQRLLFEDLRKTKNIISYITLLENLAEGRRLEHIAQTESKYAEWQ